MSKEAKLYNIFVVEDDPTYRKMLSYFLTDKKGTKFLKYKISSFATGEEMLRYNKEKPDIVFLDYYLNGICKTARCGKDIMRALKNREPETEIVIISSKDLAIDTLDLFRSGASGYMDKKYFGANELIEVVGNLVTKIERNKYAL